MQSDSRSSASEHTEPFQTTPQDHTNHADADALSTDAPHSSLQKRPASDHWVSGAIETADQPDISLPAAKHQRPPLAASQPQADLPLKAQEPDVSADHLQQAQEQGPADQLQQSVDLNYASEPEQHDPTSAAGASALPSSQQLSGPAGQAQPLPGSEAGASRGDVVQGVAGAAASRPSGGRADGQQVGWVVVGWLEGCMLLLAI